MGVIRGVLSVTSDVLISYFIGGFLEIWILLIGLLFLVALEYFVIMESFLALIADFEFGFQLFFYLEGKIKDNFEFFKDDNKNYNNYYYCYC